MSKHGGTASVWAVLWHLSAESYQVLNQVPSPDGTQWIAYVAVDNSGGDISRFETRAICASMN